MMAERSSCEKVSTVCRRCSRHILSDAVLLKTIIVIIVQRLNYVILIKSTLMLRILMSYPNYLNIEITSFYLLEKVTFPSPSLLMPTVNIYYLKFLLSSFLVVTLARAHAQ